MFCSLNSLGLMGLTPYLVSVEIDITKAMPTFEIVGLPDTAVKESRDRVRAAVKNCGFPFPEGKIVVNLAPATMRKGGAMYDLPILLGILKASGALAQSLDGIAFIGELSLGGDIRPVNGVLAMILEAQALGIDTVFIPFDNAAEGAVAQGVTIYPVKTVRDILLHLRQEQPLTPASAMKFDAPIQSLMADLCDVRGQHEAKRALEIAAAANHNLLLIGPPGTGKSMLAKRLPSILPEMRYQEAIETTKIHSVSGTLPQGVSLLHARPFRAPHHTVSPSGLSGGGSTPKPGEISLSHNGVLFLDELPEFARSSMEVLRQPLEDGTVTISRVNARLTYPSAFMLVAAMNPCPCGYFGHPTKKCICTEKMVAKYLNRVSGPLLDRLDIHVEVAPVEYESLASKNAEESSAEIRRRVIAAREIQDRRFAGTNITSNAKITPSLLHELCPMTEGANRLLKLAFERMGLSGRAYDRILKVARTIADLDGSEVLQEDHISEAVQYRSLDRKYWNRGEG